MFVAEDAKLSAPFVNLALIPEAASTIPLRERIGHARAYAMFALGEPIDGKIAVAWGIANAALPRSEVRGRALEPTLVVRPNTYTPPVRVFLTAQMRIRLAPILRRITRQQIAVFRSPSRFLKRKTMR